METGTLVSITACFAGLAFCKIGTFGVAPEACRTRNDEGITTVAAFVVSAADAESNAAVNPGAWDGFGAAGAFAGAIAVALDDVFKQLHLFAGGEMGEGQIFLSIDSRR